MTVCCQCILHVGKFDTVLFSRDLHHRDFNHAAVSLVVTNSGRDETLLSCPVPRLGTAAALQIGSCLSAHSDRLPPLACLRTLTRDTTRRHVACAVGIGWFEGVRLTPRRIQWHSSVCADLVFVSAPGAYVEFVLRHMVQLETLVYSAAAHGIVDAHLQQLWC